MSFRRIIGILMWIPIIADVVLIICALLNVVDIPVTTLVIIGNFLLMVRVLIGFGEGENDSV
jgi:hypothetical protein